MRVFRPVVRTVGGVPKGLQDVSRVQEIAVILVKHGLGFLVAGLPGVPRSRRFDSNPDRACAAIQELGPTFVKLGQVMSTRPDILPDTYIEAFQALQDDVDPVPFAEIAPELETELGEGWLDHVAEFDETPLATASIAQVHRATLADGAQVVFKVRRPGIVKTIRADLRILNFLARRLLHEYPEARSFDPRGILAEFERSLESELDFLLEAENMRRFDANFAADPTVLVPRVYDEYTTRGVLCMEYFDGVKMRRAREAGFDMEVVGQRYLTVAYEMLFVHGFFHGDLHPGNVVVMEDEVLGLLDFGMVGRLTEEMRNYVISIIFALQKGDFRTIARLFYEIAIKDERVDYQRVEHDTVEVMEKHWVGGSIKDMQMGAFVMDLAQRAARHGARVPQSYTMFFKAILTSEGLAKSLIEEVDPIGAAQPYFQRMLMERMSGDRLQQDLFYSALTLTSLGNRIPVTLSQFLEDVDQQRVHLNIRDASAERSIRARDRLVNRVIMASFAVTSAVCATLSLDVARVYGVPVLSVLLYLASVPPLLLTLLMMVRNRGKRPRR